MIETRDNTVYLIVSFSSFSAGSSYRLGVGCEAGEVAGAKLELVGEDPEIEFPPVQSFRQGHNTQQWWGVKELDARGYVLDDVTLPAPGARLRLRVEVPLAVAREKGRLFLFVAREYAEGIWYLEDGTPIEEEDW